MSYEMATSSSAGTTYTALIWNVRNAFDNPDSQAAVMGSAYSIVKQRYHTNEPFDIRFFSEATSGNKEGISLLENVSVENIYAEFVPYADEDGRLEHMIICEC